MANDIEVNTSFKVVDDATGTIRRIESAADRLHKTSMKTQGAVGAIPSAHEGGTAPADASERDRLRSVREEVMLRRGRMREVRLHSAQEDAAHKGSQTVLALTGSKGGELAEHMIRGSESLQAFGTQLAAMGGKAGKFGVQLENVGSKVMVLGGAFAVGYAAGEFLNEKFHLTGKILHLFGMNVDKYLTKANEEYARALGYRTAADYGAARKAEERLKSEVKINAAIEKEVSHMAALPTDKTGAAMGEYNTALIETAKRISKFTNEKYEDVLEKLAESAKDNVASHVKRSQLEVKLAKIEDDFVKSAPAMMFSSEDVSSKQAYVAQLAESHRKLLANNGLTEAEIAARGDTAVAKAMEAKDIFAKMEQAQTQQVADAKMESATYEAEKQLRKLHLTWSNLDDVMSQLQGTALQMATVKGIPELAPEIFKKLAESKLSKLTNHFDFRNSRFDIKQSFAADFDPDRIAVAFSNDLARLGEMRTQSGFSPVFGVR